MRLKNFLLLAPFVLVHCATVTADSDQVISVATTPPGAHCHLKNDVGNWKIANTPAQVKVDRSYGDLVIHCEKAGLSANATLEAKTRGRAWGNLLMLGLPATVDALDGAGYEYQYPDVKLTLERK